MRFGRLARPRKAVLGLQRFGCALLMVGLGACGGGLDDPLSREDVLELTFVSVEQFAPPSPLPTSPELPTRLVTVDVALVLLASERPATLSLAFTGPSGLRTNNELDLTALAPEVAASTGGRKDFRALLTIPELGDLAFDAALADRAGAVSVTVSGHFTIQMSVSTTQSNQIRDSNQHTQ
jgi:hypothetical protein